MIIVEVAYKAQLYETALKFTSVIMESLYGFEKSFKYVKQ